MMTKPSRYVLATWHGDNAIDRYTGANVTPRELLESHDALLAALESLMARDLENRLSGFPEVEQARAAIAAARGEG